MSKTAFHKNVNKYMYTTALHKNVNMYMYTNPRSYERTLSFKKKLIILLQDIINYFYRPKTVITVCVYFHDDKIPSLVEFSAKPNRLQCF